MAFTAMESVRVAEQKAENRIKEAVMQADEAVEQAKKSSDSIVSAAKKDAEIAVAHSTDKASSKAEEITVTTRNNSLLEADKLKKQCLSQQDAVNEAILKLIL